MSTRIQSAFNLLKRLGFAVLFLGANAFAQELDTIWTRTYFPCNNSDGIFAVSAYPVGGVIVGGSHSGGARGYIQRIDENQNVVWTQDTLGSRVALVSDLITEENGDIVFAAISLSEQYSGVIGKLNALGDTVWVARNEEIPGRGYGRSICKGVDGGYILLSHAFHTLPSGPEILVQHVDTSGENIWSRTIDISWIDDAWDIVPFADGYVFAGTTFSLGHEDSSYTSVVKLAASGDSCWTILLERGYDDNTQAAVTTLGDSLIVVAGHRWDSMGSFHRTVFVSLLDSSGTVLWNWYSRAEVDYDVYELHTLSSGDILAVGTEYSPISGPDGLLFCIRPFEGLQWEMTSNAGYEEFFHSAAILADDHFIAGGATNSWPNCHESPDDWLVGFGRPSPVRNSQLLSTSFSFSTYPNPFNSTLSISLEIPSHQEVTLTLHNLLGQQVDQLFQGRLTSPKISYTPPPTLASGIYFIQAKTPTKSHTHKVVLLK